MSKQHADDMQQGCEASWHSASRPVLCGIGRGRPGRGWRRMLHGCFTDTKVSMRQPWRACQRREIG